MWNAWQNRSWSFCSPLPIPPAFPLPPHIRLVIRCYLSCSLSIFQLRGICLYILDVCVAHRSTIRSVKCLALWQRCWSRRIRPWSTPSRPRCRRISGTSANAAWRPWKNSYRTMTLRSTLTNQPKSPSFLARIDFYQWKCDGMKPNRMLRKSNRHTQLLEFMVTTEQWRWQKNAPNVENVIVRKCFCFCPCEDLRNVFWQLTKSLNSITAYQMCD